MSVTKTRLLPALVVTGGLVVGAVLALVLSETKEADPCFGYGELISRRTYTVTEDSAENAKFLGLDLAPGEEREARECRAGRFETVTIDGPTGTVFSRFVDYGAALEYYTEHPEEAPGEQLRQTVEAARQAEFVPPDIDTLKPLLVAGCESAWSQRNTPSQGVHVCYPKEWVADDSIPHRVLIGTKPLGEEASVVLNIQPNSVSLECDSPAGIATAIGTVQVCAVRPQFGGQSHHLLLPNGVRVFVFLSDGAPSHERAAAFRVAMSVQTLP